MTESFDRLLSLQLIGVSAFNIADYILTLEVLDRGYIEANPILSPMIGTFQFPMVKLLLVPLLLLFIWQIRHRIGKELVKLAWIPFVWYFMLMIYFRVVLIR